jgi:hypothetical protein
MTEAPVSHTNLAEGRFIADAIDFGWHFRGSRRALRIAAGDRRYDRLTSSGTFR